MKRIILAAVLFSETAMAAEAPPASPFDLSLPQNLAMDNAPLSQLAFSGVLTISGCCSIGHDGHVTMAEGVTLDDASRRFWDAVSQLGMQNCKPPPPGKTTP